MASQWGDFFTDWLTTDSWSFVFLSGENTAAGSSVGTRLSRICRLGNQYLQWIPKSRLLAAICWDFSLDLYVYVLKWAFPGQSLYPQSQNRCLSTYHSRLRLRFSMLVPFHHNRFCTLHCAYSSSPDEDWPDIQSAGARGKLPTWASTLSQSPQCPLQVMTMTMMTS